MKDQIFCQEEEKSNSFEEKEKRIKTDFVFSLLPFSFIAKECFKTDYELKRKEEEFKKN